jgi:[ribosomal protein S5]-alanine N-acetyltransferase
MEACLEGRGDVAARLAGVDIPDEWLADTVPLVAMRLQQLRDDPSARRWLLRLVILRRPRLLVGHVNFHAPPADEGWVEIGYTVLPEHRRRGYALEASAAMFEWAAEQGVKRFRASVSPSNTASLALVRRMGFRETGVQWDEVDGEELVFEASHSAVRRALGPRAGGESLP